MLKKYHEALYDYIKTGGEGLVVKVEGRALRFRLPTYQDVVNSGDYSYFESDKNTYLLASCLQSVGGFSVSEEVRFETLKYFEGLPKFTNRVISYFWKSVRDSQEYAGFFEAFCYTQHSKNLWDEWKYSSQFGFNLHAKGYPLTDLQKSWISFNELEDRKVKVDDEWSRAFFVASSMNPKGVQKIQKDWDRKKQEDLKFRQKIIEEANKGVGVKEEDKGSLKGEKSVEELQKEYWNWVEGYEDDHDKAVREYKEQVQRHMDERRGLIKRQEQQVREMTEQLAELNSLSMSSPIRAYTDDEVAKMTQGRQTTTITFDEGTEYAGQLSDRLLKAPQLPSSRLPSLQDQIEGRPAPKIER